MTAPEPSAGELAGRRVLFVLYYYAPYASGLSIYIRNLAEHLAGLGARVGVLAGDHTSGLPPEEWIDGVQVRRVRSLTSIGKGMVMPGFVPRAIAAARHADIVIPVMPMLECALICRAVPVRKLLPVYVCDLRLDGRLGGIVEGLAARSARSAIRRSGRFVALSLEYAQASRVVGDLAGACVGVQPPVDPARFAPCDSRALRTRLGLAEREVVGFVGRLVAEKGLDVLIEAVRRLRRARPEVALVIAGDGTDIAGGGLDAELRALANDDPDIRFTGFLSDSDLRAFYSMCAVLALPSVDPLEAFGMVQVEAMLCGTPVVASDLPGVRGPVTMTGMGRLCTAGDAAALADALGTVLRDRTAFVRPHSEIAAILDPTPALQTFAALVASR